LDDEELELLELLEEELERLDEDREEELGVLDGGVELLEKTTMREDELALLVLDELLDDREELMLLED